MRDLRIAQGLGNRAIGRRGNALLVQLGETSFGRDRPRPSLDAVHQVRPIVAAIRIVDKARVVHPFRTADHLHQALEGFFAGDRDHDKAVQRFDRTVHRPRGRLNLELRPLQFIQGEAQHQFQHRHVDMLAASGDGALVERRRNRAERVDAGQDVGMVDAAIIRPAAAGLIGEMRHVVTGCRVNDRGIGRQFGGGTGLAISGDRAIDQFRIERVQGRVIEPQAAHHAGSEIFDQNVSAREQPADELQFLPAISGRAPGSSCRH